MSSKTNETTSWAIEGLPDRGARSSTRIAAISEVSNPRNRSRGASKSASKSSALVSIGAPSFAPDDPQDWSPATGRAGLHLAVRTDDKIAATHATGRIVRHVPYADRVRDHDVHRMMIGDGRKQLFDQRGHEPTKLVIVEHIALEHARGNAARPPAASSPSSGGRRDGRCWRSTASSCPVLHGIRQ